MEKSIVILTGGGPAPGMNTVVGSIAKTFISNGYRVLGLHGGYKGLFSKNPKFTHYEFFCECVLHLGVVSWTPLFTQGRK